MKIQEAHWARAIRLAVRHVNRDRDVRVASDYMPYERLLYVFVAISPWWSDFFFWRRRCQRTTQEIERMAEAVLPGARVVVDVCRGYEIPEDAPGPTQRSC